MRASHLSGSVGQDQLLPEVHDEVDRLPEKYRQPIVLCYLEGLTHEKAAGQLRLPVGTVKVRRARLENKETGATVQPAAVAWQTPQQVCITEGLRHAAADAMLTQSAQNALNSVEAKAGEPGLLCKAELLKVVHQQGQELRQAAAQRASAALAEHPQAKELLLPVVAPAQPEELVAEAAEPAVGPWQHVVCEVAG